MSMKLPWIAKAADGTKNKIKPNSKDVAERLHQSGEQGTLVLSTDKLVKKYRSAPWPTKCPSRCARARS